MVLIDPRRASFRDVGVVGLFYTSYDMMGMSVYL